MKHMSIRTRILGGMVAVMAVGAIAVAVYLHMTFSTALDVSAQKLVTESQAAWQNAQELDAQKLAAAAVTLQGDGQLVSALKAGNKSGLQAEIEPLFAQLKKSAQVSDIMIVKADGSVLYSAAMPDATGLVASGSTYEKAKGGTDVVSGIDVTKAGAVMAATVPVLSSAGDKVGFIRVTQTVDGLVEDLGNATGANYLVMVDKGDLDEAQYAKARQVANLSNDWGDRDNYVVAATSDEDAAGKVQFNAAADSVPEMGKVVGVENGSCSKTCHKTVKGSGDYWRVTWSEDSITRAHAVFPFSDSAGKPAGVIYAIQDVSAQADSARGSVVKTLFVIGIMLVAATLVIGWMLDTLVFMRLNRMILSMEDLSVRVAGGDFDATFTPDGTDDEIGHFEQFFARFMSLMTGTIKSLAE